MCSGSGPIAWTWNRELCPCFDTCWYQHCFVAWQYRLAESDVAASFVGTPNVCSTVHTVWFIWKRLMNVAIVVAKEPAVHRRRISVCGSLRIPLRHHLARRASVRTIMSGLTALIRTHGPSTVLVIWSDYDQSRIGWKLTLSTSLFNICCPDLHDRIGLCYRRAEPLAAVVPVLERVVVRVAMLCGCRSNSDCERRADCAECRVLHWKVLIYGRPESAGIVLSLYALLASIPIAT